MYSERKKKYNHEYDKKNYKLVPVRFRYDSYEKIMAAVNASGESLNGYVNKAIEMRMKADGLTADKRRWYLIEDCTTRMGEIFDTELKARSREAAIKEAVTIWNKLRKRDQDLRDDVYIFFGERDEDGILLLDKGESFIDIREEANAQEAVFNSYHEEVNYAAAVALMDDEIRERLHREMAPCSNQEFYDAYCEAHETKFGEEFTV